MNGDKQLLKEWDIKKLGEVCEVIAGQSPEGRYYNNKEEGLPFYQGKKEFTKKYIGKPKKWTTKVTKEALKDDILISVRAPVGPINYSTQKICIGRGLAAIRASGKIEREYLYNFLVKHENEIVGNTGAVFNSINKSQIGAIQIPLPPLSEQKRIVSILDKAFKAINLAKTNAEQNLKNAKELFESYLQNIFENKGDDWVEKKLGEVCEIQLGKTPYRKTQSFWDRDKETSNVWLSIADMKHGEELFDSKEYISDLGVKNIKYVPKDTLMLSFKLTLGRVSFSGKDLFTNEAIASLVKLSPKVDKKFLFYYFSFFDWHKETEGDQKVKGRTLNKEKLKSLSIIVPSLPEQKQIVKKLDALQTQTKKLETLYQQKINNLVELKKSVLQKAFAGELT